ncbi:hypothetical protein Igag_1640 [Ignisphaera aggregans DSM 17230]|uniref:Uncharacterized protein n=1 Tax=Ignisphaera aggregans (strain DSM 17230 / JCM 13409 / AQ1.S1) TaxID=583356 RepID=E0SRQ7_IGNAA|nr:hypothetical protein Igag_1640 [Ignisphaera aggregans DSM 17230]
MTLSKKADNRLDKVLPGYRTFLIPLLRRGYDICKDSKDRDNVYSVIRDIMYAFYGEENRDLIEFILRYIDIDELCNDEFS